MIHSKLMADAINKEILELSQPTFWSAQQYKNKF